MITFHIDSVYSPHTFKSSQIALQGELLVISVVSSRLTTGKGEKASSAVLPSTAVPISTFVRTRAPPTLSCEASFSPYKAIAVVSSVSFADFQRRSSLSPLSPTAELISGKMLQQSDEFSSGMAPDYRLQEPRLQSDLTHLPPPSLPDSCGASSDNGAFALQPPTLGYGQGCYIPPLSRPSVGFPPVGYYSSSVSSYGTNVSASYTSWSSYQPALQYAGAGRDYSLPSSQIFAPPAYPAFSLQPPPPPPPPPSVSSYAGAPPLHHPETLDLPSSFVVLSGRKRQRPVDEDAIEAVDSNLPAKNSRQHHGPSSLEMPTPPDSSSDRSETVSPQSFFHQLHNLPPLQPHSQILPHPPPPAAAVAVSPVVAVPAPPPPQNGVHVTLSTKTEELWNLFYAANTEMIVTKNGR